MTEHTESLLHEALSLTEGERADLVAELLVSLEAPPIDDAEAVERAWAEELERRARRAVASPTRGETWDLVRERVGGALSGE